MHPDWHGPDTLPAFWRMVSENDVGTVVSNPNPSPSPSPGPGPGPNQALLRLATGLDRQQTAPAAPPEGLCLSRVGYGAYSAGDSE